MNIRYQVFVSSTYVDLKDERSKVIQTIMELDCIPAGMELFPAMDEEQFNFIKRIIDDCDYYLLIIGGRYGSISEDGLSYTEKEYDYAIQKGIKVIAFIHSNPDSIAVGKSEIDASLREKLNKFKSKVSDGRLIKSWNNAEELPGLVALSLSKTIKTYPALGWIRANTITNPEFLEELNQERKENLRLKADLESLLLIQYKGADENLAGLEDYVTITGIYFDDNPRIYFPWVVTSTWGKVFFIISPYLINEPIDHFVEKKLSSELFKETDNIGTDMEIDSDLFESIKIHLKALGLVNILYSSGNFYWSLTEKGEATMVELRSFKKPKNY